MSEEESNLSSQWGEYDPKVAQQETADMEGDGTPWLKLAPGRTSVRVLPASRASGRKTPFVQRFMHYYRGSKLTKTNKRVVVGVICPRKHTKGSEKCAVCQEMWDMERSGDPVIMESAKEMWAKPSLLCNVILPEDLAQGIRVHGFSKKQKETLDEFNKKYGDYSNPMNGYDIDIKKTGDGIDSRYELFPGMERRPLSAVWPELRADQMVDLEALVIVPTFAQTLAAIASANGAESSPGDNALVGRTGPPALSAPRTPAAPRARSVGDVIEAKTAARAPAPPPIELED